MDGVTKARINLKDGTIELEGSEIFVSKYLDEFKLHVAINVAAQDGAPEVSLEAEVRQRPAHQSSATGKVTNSSPKKQAKKLKPEEFDTLANDSKPSLADFIKQKQPRASASEYIAVVGYYITKLNSQAYFTEGNIEFAYRIAGLGKPPLKMHQSLLDAKSKKFYVEEAAGEDLEGAWNLSRIGEQFVEYELPREDK